MDWLQTPVRGNVPATRAKYTHIQLMRSKYIIVLILREGMVVCENVWVASHEAELNQPKPFLIGLPWKPRLSSGPTLETVLWLELSELLTSVVQIAMIKTQYSLFLFLYQCLYFHILTPPPPLSVCLCFSGYLLFCSAV